MNTQVVPKASLYLRVLLALMLISTTMPIFTGYAAGFLLLCWIVNEQIKGRLSIRDYIRGVLPTAVFDEPRAGSMLRLVFWAMALIFAGLVLAGIVGQFTSPWAGDVSRTLNRLVHQFLKLVLLGSVALIALLESVRRGAGTLYLAKVFVVWMAAYFVYCMIQRYTGIDWTNGIDARLGPHRYAYGVYRVSGAMGHPLTLTYNLMVIVLATAGLAIRQFQVNKFSAEFKLWTAVSLLALSTIMISGSRFVIIVLVMVLILCEMPRIFKYWKAALLVCVLFAVALWLEGSVAGRFGEFFAQNQNLEERFPRLVFWKVHWQMFIDNPVAGVTLSGLSKAVESYYHASGIYDKMYTAHNVFLQFLADSGLIGFAGLMAFFIGYLKSTIQSVKAVGRITGLSYLFVATVLVSLQQNILRDSEYLVSFWLFTGLLFTAIFRTRPIGDGIKRKSLKDLEPAAGGKDSSQNLSS